MSNWISKYLAGTFCLFCIVFAQCAWSTTGAHFQSAAKNAEQHYKEHKNDVKACIVGFEYLNQNEKELLTIYSENAVLGRPIDFLETLKKSKFARQQSIKHILDNPTRFDIWPDCHSPSTAKTIHCISCEPKKELRAKKIESLGISRYGWFIREELLNESLNILNQPGCEACYGVDFEYFLVEVKKTKSIYEASYSAEMRTWLKMALYKIRKDGVGGEGSAGTTAKEQNEELERRIKTLTEVIK